MQERGGAVAETLGWPDGVDCIAGAVPGRPVKGWRASVPIMVALALSGGWVMWVFR